MGEPVSGTGEGLHVFLGTKAQYIKTAPVLRALDARGVPYRLIDSGQHARLSIDMRRDLEVRQPDVVLGGDRDVDTVTQAVRWSLGLAAKLVSARRIRDDVFAGQRGICVVHGDTPTTLLAAVLARRAGLRVAHLEAGLRSRSLLHPFPEELIRLAVMRVSDLLFAPDAAAVANLAEMRFVRGRVIPLSANTSVDSLVYARAETERGGIRGPASPDTGGQGPAIVTMHRVENLHRRQTVEGFVALAERIADRYRTRFVVHGPTREAIAKAGLEPRLQRAGIEMVPLQPHPRFVAMLAAAPLVVTDGGSIQEECALLGVPTLLWRARTERPDGLGANVLLSRYDPVVVDEFLAHTDRWRCDPAGAHADSPSEQIVDVLLAELGRMD